MTTTAGRLTSHPVALPRRPRGGGSQLRWVRDHSATVVSLTVGAIGWEIVGRVSQLAWFPPFSAVVTALWDLTWQGLILGNLVVSLRSMLIGFAFSAVFGVLIGGLMGRYRKVEWALDIYVNALLVAPTVVFAPIFFSIFGLSDWSRIAVVVLYALFIVIQNTFTAFRTVDPALIEMATSFGAGERQIFTRVMVPGAMPLTMAGLRLGMGRSVKGMINGEMLIALVGLGALVERFGASFQSARVLAIVLTVVIVALVMAAIVQWIDRRVTAWSD